MAYACMAFPCGDIKRDVIKRMVLLRQSGGTAIYEVHCCLAWARFNVWLLHYCTGYLRSRKLGGMCGSGWRRWSRQTPPKGQMRALASLSLALLACPLSWSSETGYRCALHLPCGICMHSQVPSMRQPHTSLVLWSARYWGCMI